MPDEKYKHGIDTSNTDTEMQESTDSTQVQVVIGTAPVHLLDDPTSAVNKPILCRSITDCKTKIGYSEDFDKYTLCQSMYATFVVCEPTTVVFINVLDPAKHYTAVADREIQINNNSFTIDDSVIVSTLKIKNGEDEIAETKYVTEWADGVLTVNFAENTEGTVTVSYNKADPTKVTRADIIGSWNTATDIRTGAELIKNIQPLFGVIPIIAIAPGWTTDDTVSAILKEKVKKINGCYKGVVIADIDTTTARTRAAAIEAKNSRTFDEDCIAAFPMVKKGGHIFYFSAMLAAVIMSLAAKKGGMTCDSPSNKAIDIDDCVLADGTSVNYDAEDGNELNGAGIVTIISRTGWYVWGNNTAAFPKTTDPVKRFIMTRLSFHWTENDFIDRYFSDIDEALDKKMVENCVTDYNIILASRAGLGYIAAGKIIFNAGDNPSNNIKKGRFTFRTALAANIPTEYVTNIFSFDEDALMSKILGGEQ